MQSLLINFHGIFLCMLCAHAEVARLVATQAHIDPLLSASEDQIPCWAPGNLEKGTFLILFPFLLPPLSPSSPPPPSPSPSSS